MKIWNFLRTKALLLTIVMIFFACDGNNDISEIEEVSSVPEEVQDLLWRYGVNGTLAERSSLALSGTDFSMKGYRVDDVFIPESTLPQIQEIVDGWENAAGRTDAFRTTNLVSSPTTGVRKIVIEAFEDSLTPIELAGIGDAVAEYNSQLDLRLEFELVFSPTTIFPSAIGADIVVGRVPDPTGAIFPFNGNPGDIIGFNADLIGLSQSVIKFVFMHELGHAIGLRHSDYQTRISCVNLGDPLAINEGEGQLGAICIPGTNCNGNDTNSIMAACADVNNLPSTFIGEDQMALEILYGR